MLKSVFFMFATVSHYILVRQRTYFPRTWSLSYLIECVIYTFYYQWHVHRLQACLRFRYMFIDTGPFVCLMFVSKSSYPMAKKRDRKSLFEKQKQIWVRDFGSENKVSFPIWTSVKSQKLLQKITLFQKTHTRVQSMSLAEKNRYPIYVYLQYTVGILCSKT